MMQAMRLLRLDAGSVVQRLRGRRETMLRAFSMHRDRRALLDPVRSTLDGLDAQGWCELPGNVGEAAWRFNEALDAWRWYARYTEDMPGTVGTTLDAHHREIEGAWARLQAALTEAEAAEAARGARKRPVQAAPRVVAGVKVVRVKASKTGKRPTKR